MNISSVSGPAAALPWVAQKTDPAQDPDGDAHGGEIRHRHGGGHMKDAVAAALQGIGVTIPQARSAATETTATPSTPAVGASGDAGSNGDSAARGIRHDVRHLMHALFEAVKGETPATSGTGAGSTSAPNGNAGAAAGGNSGFAGKLAALIAQVSGGNAPSELQAAFSKLVTDVKGAGGANAAPTGPTSGSSSGNAPTLQAFLTRLQQNLGYGASSPAVGSLVVAQA